MPLSWLKRKDFGDGRLKVRRTLANKGKRIEPEQILKWLDTRSWKYSWTPDFYKLRDKALIALLFICCGRIGEVLELTKEQFKEQKHFVVLREYRVEKNKVNPIRDDWALPKRGRLAPFTAIIMEYLEKLPQNRNKLFKIKRARAHQIVKHITSKWCHWFRAMGEAHYMRTVFKDPVKCASALRLRRSDTLIEYVPYEWKDYEKQLSA